MNTDLAHWQAHLTRHFTELRRRRSRVPGGSVFALEHGLGEQDINSLAIAVRAHIARQAPANEHCLAWIVYAAEIGYRYSGDEYWQTFENETPGWTVHGDRYWIRRCFQKFQREFAGASPTGAWAEHFSIICWPITHAILPKDLQRQLAQILYELRHSFYAELFESPVVLGEFIASRSWNATSRFQNFAQEPQLVGQIAAALLLQGEHGTESLIHSATLERIGEDLDQERRSREWLRSARRLAHERATIRGLGLIRGTSTSPIQRRDDARVTVSMLGIEPRIVLQPSDIMMHSWDVSLEIPDLSHLLFRFPKTRDILAGTRCVVAGAAGRPRARGSCLHGSQRVRLIRWPRPDEVLLQFEQSDPQLDYLLRTECLLRPGSLWLFRIASDGLAHECRSLRVRPGERYIVISTSDRISFDEHIRSIELSCDGVFGGLLDLPDALTIELEESLRHLGLRQARSIDVWPSGLAAVVWDGEGRGEWLTSERPCLAVRTDHPVEALIVTISGDTEESIELAPVVPGEPMFVELPQLPVGLHTVCLSTRASSSSDAEALGSLDVVIRIREARRWSPGISPHGPLQVELEPSAPTLEDLWEGKVSVSVRGPIGRHVECFAALRERSDEAPTFEARLPPLPLPVSATAWTSHFLRHFVTVRKAQSAYDTARMCEVEFRADELGTFTVRCEREFSPLRWIVRRDSHGYVARLLDDSGQSQQPIVGRMAFETPLVDERLELASDFHVPRAGGMYYARLGDLTASAIAPAQVSGLDDLCCIPHIAEEERSAVSVLRAIAIARIWGDAKLPGDLISAKRKRDVLDAIATHAFRVIGGQHWWRAEAADRDGNQGLTRLKDAVSRRREEAAIAVILARDCGDLASATCKERVSRLAGIAQRFLSLSRQSSPHGAEDARGGSMQGTATSEDGEWLCELALRLASDVKGAEQWAAEQARPGVTRLIEHFPTLARAARFLVLSIDRHLQSNQGEDEIYAGWRWS